MIYVLLKGGLGNQLFQYQFGQYLSEKYGEDVSYCIEKHRFGNCLYKVGINAHIVNSKKMNFYGSKHNYFIKFLKKLFPKALFKFMRLFGVYYWDNPNEIEIGFRKNKKDKYFIGYWQFNDIYIYKKIQMNFSNVDPQAIRISQMLDDNSCFVHVRRGDYVKAGYLFVCTEYYYKSAMKTMSEKNSNVKFFVFSNDIVWCKAHFADYDCVYIDNVRDDSSEFYLLSLFKNAIISNSTFSYCAINAGVYPQNVIAPNIWRKGRLSKHRSIYDSRWVVLPVE